MWPRMSPMCTKDEKDVAQELLQGKSARKPLSPEAVKAFDKIGRHQNQLLSCDAWEGRQKIMRAIWRERVQARFLSHVDRIHKLSSLSKVKCKPPPTPFAGQHCHAHR